MVRKAVVIVPSEEDYKARLEAQEKAETKDVPDNAVMEMKGTYRKTLSQRLSFLYLHTLSLLQATRYLSLSLSSNKMIELDPTHA